MIDTKKLPWAGLGTTVVTEESVKEAEALGITIPEGLAVAKEVNWADAILVCQPADEDPKSFTDNVEAVCAWCNRKIIHRPHAPKEINKVCTHCAIDAAKAPRQ